MIYIFFILGVFLFISFNNAAFLMASFDGQLQTGFTRGIQKNYENPTIFNPQQNQTRETTQKAEKNLNTTQITSTRTTIATTTKQLLYKFTYPKVEMKNINQTLKELFQLKHQCIVRNHIEDIETQYALDFVPNWKIIVWQSSARKSIEIRRQKWEYILKKHRELLNLATNLALCGIDQKEFCKQIANAYFILSHNLYINEFGANSSATVHQPKLFQYVRDPVLEKSIQILMRSLPSPELELDEIGELASIKSLEQNWVQQAQKNNGNSTSYNHPKQNSTSKIIQQIQGKDSSTTIKQLLYESKYPKVGMKNINQILTDLYQLKHQCIVRNHIEDIETQYAPDFVPNWNKILIWKTPARRSIEIRCQKWEHILNNHSLELHNLTINIAECGMKRSEFCNQIAYAYFVLAHNLYVNGFGMNFSAAVYRPKLFQQVRDPILEKSIQILMRSLPTVELEFKDIGELIKIPKELYIDLKRNLDDVRNFKWYCDSEERRAREKLNNIRRRKWDGGGHEKFSNRARKGGKNIRNTYSKT